MKMKIVFHNLEKSEFVENAVTDRLFRVIEKFPEYLRKATATIFVSMENSPVHPGRDLFGVRLMVVGAHKKPLVIEKEAENVYEASAVLADRLLEFLSRASHRQNRVRRHVARLSRYHQKWFRPPGAALD